MTVVLIIDFSVNFSMASRLFTLKLLCVQQSLMKMQITIKTYPFTLYGTFLRSFQYSAPIRWMRLVKWLMQMHVIRFHRLGENSVLNSWMKVQLLWLWHWYWKKFNLQFVFSQLEDISHISCHIESLDVFQPCTFERKRVWIQGVCVCVSICTALHSLTSIAVAAIDASAMAVWMSLRNSDVMIYCFQFFLLHSMFAVMSICAWHYKWFNKHSRAYLG